MGMVPVGGMVLASILSFQEAPATLAPLLKFPTDGTVLGSIADVDMLPNGNFLVLDGQAHQVLVFDREGALLQTMGQDGQGPGEIRGAAELEVSEDGTVWVVDFGNSRITRWDSSGELKGSNRLGEVLGQPTGWPHELVVGEAGVFLKTSQFSEEAPVRIFRLHEDLRGVADTVAVVIPTPGASTCMFCPVSIGPSGRAFGAQGDTAFAVSEIGRNGEQISILRREGVPAVKRSEDEMARLRSAAGRLPIPEGVDVPEPEFSPYQTRFGPHSIGSAEDGLTWLAPRVAEGESTVFFLFDAEGQFLSSVSADASLGGFKIRGSHLLAIGETPIGEPIVRVYEIR